MTDFHTHLLPAMDDGSKDVETSLRMLEKEENDGIKRVVLTPHFYPTKENPADFLERRASAFGKLCAAYTGNIALVPGAEVYFYDGLSRSGYLPEFCIGETSVILIEMPFARWTEGQLGEIFDMDAAGYIPVIAHAERYLEFHNKKMIRRLAEEGILLQSNAEFFIDRKTRRTAAGMLKDGMIRLLGSDCHNLTTRAPVLGECFGLLGDDKLREMSALADRLLG